MTGRHKTLYRIKGPLWPVAYFFGMERATGEQQAPAAAPQAGKACRPDAEESAAQGPRLALAAQAVARALIHGEDYHIVADLLGERFTTIR